MKSGHVTLLHYLSNQKKAVTKRHPPSTESTTFGNMRELMGLTQLPIIDNDRYMDGQVNILFILDGWMDKRLTLTEID